MDLTSARDNRSNNTSKHLIIHTDKVISECNTISMKNSRDKVRHDDVFLFDGRRRGKKSGEEFEESDVNPSGFM